MEKLLPKFRQIYGRAESYLEEWARVQSRLEDDVAIASNIKARLPILADDSNFGPLAAGTLENKVAAGGANVPALVRAKQMWVLEGILARHHTHLDQLQACALGLDKCSKDGEQLVAGARAAGATSLAPRALALGFGARPSLSQLVEGLADLSRMYRQQHALTAGVVEMLPSASVEDCGPLAQLLEDEPCIDKECGGTPLSRQVLSRGGHHVMSGRAWVSYVH
eukprot:jgi/Mesvir1/15934/Mv08257-RA.1